MAEFFESRKLRYEIHKLCDKRWQIAEVVGDGREQRGGRFGRSEFEEVERAVLAKAKAAGGDVKARGQALLGFIGELETKARDAMAEKRLPTIEGGDFKRFYERMAARYDGEMLRFSTMVAVTRHFQGTQSFLAKL